MTDEQRPERQPRDTPPGAEAHPDDARPVTDAQPGIDVPGIDVPGIDVPGADVPGVDVPGIAQRGIDEPRGDTSPPGEARTNLASRVAPEPPEDDGDEPTVATPLPPGEEEVTVHLAALPPATDEPARPRGIGDGETVRLHKSFLVPGKDAPAHEIPVADPTAVALDPGAAGEDQHPRAGRERALGRTADASPSPGADHPGRNTGRPDLSTGRPDPSGDRPDPSTDRPGAGRPGAGGGLGDAGGPPDSGRDARTPARDVPVGEQAASDNGSGVSPATPEPVTQPDQGADAAGRVPEKARRITSAGALIWVLLALLGFTLVVQLRSNDADAGLATARQEDLVGILSDLEARDQRLQQEINALEESQRQLTSGVAGREAALAEADKRAEELGLLAGTLPARGPGLKISIDPRGQPIKASAILNAVQELRGAGGEVMEIIGDNGIAVRVVASTSFVDADGGTVIVDGKQLSGPYTVWVIGVPATMQTALQIPGGVVASVSQAGGNVTMEQRSTVEVAAVRQPTSLQYARPVS